MIKVKLPDGRTIKVDAPDAQSAARAAKAFLTKESAQKRVQSEEGTMQGVDDAVRSVARGVPLVGGFMDEAAAGLNTGFGYLGDYDEELAYQRERDRAYDEQHPVASGVGQVTGALAGTMATLPLLPVKALPVSMTGRIASGAGAGAALGAEEGFARGEGGIENRLEAAVPSAGMGAVFGSMAAPIGRGVGAIVNSLPRKADVPPMPTVEQIRNASRAGYKEAEGAGLVFTPEAFERTIDDITSAAAQRGITGEFADITSKTNPVTAALVEKLERARGKAPRLQDVELMKRVASDSSDPAGPMVAGKLRSSIDNAAPEDFAAGDVKAGLRGIKKGRENWGRAERAALVDRAFYEAENAAGANYTQAGMATAIKQKFRAIANSEDFENWPPDEREAVLRVVREGIDEKILRNIGKLSPTTTTGKVLGILLGMKSLGATAGLGAVTGGARIAASRIPQKNARLAEELIKRGYLPKNASKKQVEKVIEALALTQSGQMGERTASAYGH